MTAYDAHPRAAAHALPARLDANLDGEAGGIVANALAQIDNELWHADQGAARAAGVDVRLTSRRRADALVELARRAQSVPAGAKRPRPLARVVVGYDTLERRLGVATLNGQTPLGAEAARRLCCDANLARVIVSPNGVVIDLGEARNPSAPLRHLIVARDRTCVFAGCTIDATYCDVHHILHHHDGGPTNLANLASLCSHHHRLLHEGGYGCRAAGNGSIEFTRPDGSIIGSTPRSQSFRS